MACVYRLEMLVSIVVIVVDLVRREKRDRRMHREQSILFGWLAG